MPQDCGREKRQGRSVPIVQGDPLLRNEPVLLAAFSCDNEGGQQFQAGKLDIPSPTQGELPRRFLWGDTMYRRLLALAAASTTISATAIAQTEVQPAPPRSSPHFYGTLGYSFDGAEGFELALGVQADWGNFLYVRASPLNLVLTDAKGFYRDTFSNGQSRCRDESNGQFATDGSCTGLDYRVDADLYVRLAPQLLLGGGVIHTVSSEYTPEREGQTDSFAAVMFEFNGNFGIEVRGGKDNGAVRLRAAF